MSRIDSRMKGIKYERAIAKWYRGRGIDTRRGQQARSGSDDPDVVVKAPQHKLWIECGVRKQSCWVLGKMDQAIAALEESSAKDKERWPVVHAKSYHGPDVVVLLLDDWGRILEMLER